MFFTQPVEIITKRISGFAAPGGEIMNKDEQSLQAERNAERLDEENEIVITILSEITNPPKGKIVLQP